MHELGVVLLTIDRKPPETTQHRPDQRLLEQGSFREWPRRPSRRAKDDERIDESVRMVRRNEDGTVRNLGPGSLQVVEERDRPPHELRDEAREQNGIRLVLLRYDRAPAAASTGESDAE